MSLKEQIIKNLSQRLKTDEEIVEAVVNHQFKCVVEALKVHTSVELAGFGKFLFVPHRAKLLLASLEKNMKLAEQGQFMFDGKNVETYKLEIANLKKRLAHVGESQADSGGMDQYDSEEG